MSECKSCITKRIKELEAKLLKYANSLMVMFWKQELEALENKKAIAASKSDCC